MKFDLIISNPPYTNGLDLKILESVLDLGEKIVFVHPAGYLNLKYDIKNIREKIKDRVEIVEFIDGNEIFNISNHTPISIIKIIGESNQIKVLDDIDYVASSIYNVHKYGYSIHIKSIMQKINNIKSISDYIIDNRKKNVMFFGLPVTRGNVASSDFYTFVQRQLEPHNNNKNYYQCIEVQSEKEIYNLYNLFKLKIMRFFLSIRKERLNLKSTEFKSVPWFDFTQSWDDEKCAKELGITNEELLWMISVIPDYYEDDKEKYEALTKKLLEN